MKRLHPIYHCAYTCLWILTIQFAVVTTARSQPGSLDLTFGAGGKGVVPHVLGGGYDIGRTVLVLPDGKIVTVGMSGEGDEQVCSLTRHLADGSLDTSFGNGGKLLPDPTLSIICSSAALQGDGKIVAAGRNRSGDFALIRYNSNGSLDSSFGTGGIVTTSGFGNANSIAIQVDGKLVAAGSTGNGGDFAIARYNPDGSLDSTFDGDGKVTTNIALVGGVPYEDIAFDVAIQPDGKIVAAGSSYFGGDNSDFALVRYNANGSLDPTFSGDGKVTTSLPAGFGGVSDDRAYSVAIQPDGKIVAGGHGYNAANNGADATDFALIRYDANGTLDPSFDGDGIVTTSLFYFETVFDVAIQADGKILACGYTQDSGASPRPARFAVTRYNTNGSLDSSFGNGGKATTAVGNYDIAYSMALQPDGKLLLAGSTRTASNSFDFALVRYDELGALDTPGFSGGIVTTDVGNSRVNGGHGVAIQPDGKIVSLTDNSVLLRRNADGSPDTTFDGDGFVFTGFGFYPGSLALQADGKIVVASDGDNGFTFARYNTDGSRDTSFGTGGIATINGTYLGASSMVIQPDGKLVAAGTYCKEYNEAKDVCFSTDLVLVRIDANGTPDPAFGFAGIARPDTGLIAGSTEALAMQPDGKILAAGGSCASMNNAPCEFAVVRYNADGTLDMSFDSDGVATASIGSTAVAHAIAVQADGKIVTAGDSYDASNYDFAVVRYNANGSLDPGFDFDGKTTTPVGASHDHAYSLAIQPDGKIVAAGSSGGALNDFALVRYNPDGSVDTTFGGGDGVTTVDFNKSDDAAHAMALDTQGRAVVVGESNGAFAFARFILQQVPTAAAVSVSGRVMSPDGRGVRNARVTIEGPGGARTTVTGAHGYYRFDEVPTRAVYTVSVGSRRYTFEPRVFELLDALADLDIVAVGSRSGRLPLFQRKSPARVAGPVVVY